MTGGGVRWNDESQSWETGEPGAHGTRPPVTAPVVPPVPSVPPAPATDPVPPGAWDPYTKNTSPDTAPDPYTESTASDPYTENPAPDPYARSGADAPGPYNNLTGVHGPPPAARTPRQRLVPVAAGLAVAVLAAGAAALWSTLADGDDGGRDGAQGQSASAPADEVTDPAAPEPGTEDTDVSDATGEAPSGEAASPDGSPPPGYIALDDAEGFRIAVPEEWGERSAETGGVFYRTTGGAELIQVFRVAEPGATALGSVRRASDERSGAPGFEEVGIGPVDNPLGGEAAELVYAYDHEESGGRRQVVERVFTASDDRLYAVLVAAPESDWPRHEEILDVAVTHFDPYGSPF
ncbi:serine/arginine repetitive matrix protein 2 [Streptomyces sp. CAI 127]|uniref:serine/arginine repetitive matrix protein 2 n=1 Tax=Streptomyces sp. CAI 127 TaxID=1076397 RepID=UPI00158709A2|nr:serine/arginine repetitive matrix protein 2 [Streptomyces sp. CAI 127]NUV98374.1 serine/arginine repetitive matrix protein 2 [Streptomyces sp. CAI 127]